jgi:hypothetical protein
MAQTEPFLLRSENQKFLAGETPRLSGAPGSNLLVIPVVLAVASLVAFWLAYRLREQEQAFRRNGVTVQGTVIGRHVGSSGGAVDIETGVVDSSDDYLVKYRFEAVTPRGRKTLEREASLPKEEYDKCRVGAAVAVSYDPADPSSSRMQGEGESTPHVLLTLLGTTLLTAGVLTGLFLRAAWWRNRCLTLDGTRLEGRVVSCTSKKQDGGGATLELKYRFVSPSGTVIVDSAAASRGAADLTPPAPETPLVVLYHSDIVYQVL